MDWNALVQRGESAYPKLKAGKKAYDYLKLVKGALDENTRSGSLFKLGVKGTMDIASKMIGTSLTTHPYFTYHKAHIEVLSKALDMLAAKEVAQEAFEKAVALAGATEQAASQLALYESSRRHLGLMFASMISGSLELLRDLRVNPTVGKAQLADLGTTETELRAETNKALYDYRCAWAGLADDTLQMTLMVGADTAGVEAAMKRYQKKLEALKSGDAGGNLGVIAGYALEQDRMYAEFEAHRRQTRSRSTYDPSGAARRSFDSVETMTRTIANATDAIFDDNLVFNAPDKVISALMK